MKRPSYTAPVVVVVVLLVATAALATGAWRVHDRSEQALLDRQVRQARGALTSATTALQVPLAVAASGAARGGPEAFAAVMAPLVGENGQFASAAMMDPDTGAVLRVVGDVPRLVQTNRARARAFVNRAAENPGLSVVGPLPGDPARVGFAATALGSGVPALVYAEVALPESRTSVEPDDRAYDNVDFAVYVGAEGRDDLLYGSTDALPLDGRVASVSAPFGDRRLLLVFASRENIAGWLSTNLWWIVVLVGLALAALAGVVTMQLTKARARSELLAALAAERYREQLEIAVTLQRSLLPSAMPIVPGIEIAARYEPATTHAEVGGDWYDVVEVADGRLVVMVGDVSGHGVSAATTMAALRYAARAYALDGAGPVDILNRLNRLVDTGREGRFATVLCVELDPGRTTVSVASAGHPPPLVVDPDATRSLRSAVGPPIGVTSSATYAATEFAVAPDATLLAFTDGLFERRDEDVEQGLARLQRIVEVGDGPLEGLVDQVMEASMPTEHPDDVVLIGVRWVPVSVPAGVEQRG